MPAQDIIAQCHHQKEQANIELASCLASGDRLGVAKALATLGRILLCHAGRDIVDAEMRARADGWATVNDPLSDVTIDITKQRVDVSLSCDGGVEGGPQNAPHRTFAATSASIAISPGLTTLQFGARHDWPWYLFSRTQAVADTPETMSKILEGDAVSTQPVLITGPAACGKGAVFKALDKVTWTRADAKVPAGAVGIVQRDSDAASGRTLDQPTIASVRVHHPGHPWRRAGT